jgi:putative PIN family toxin of toxin-antitoxin system
MKVVLDTNVLISAVLSPGNPPDMVLQAWRDGAFELLISFPMLGELSEALTRPKIRKRLGHSIAEVYAFVSDLSDMATIVTPRRKIRVITDDPDDNTVLEAAVAGHADYIVTGDKVLQRLRSHERTEIVTPRQFVEILQ